MFLLHATDIRKHYGERLILDIPDFSVYEGDRIALVGANGAGKTTLMEILSGRLAPDAGHVERRAEISYLRQQHGQGGMLSGGEHMKKHILEETLGIGGLLFADEPTAHLDESGRDWVRRKLRGAKTVLLVSHDRALLDEVCNRIVSLKDGKLSAFTGNYSDYLQALSEEEKRRELKHAQYLTQKERLERAVQIREQKMARQRQKARREKAKNSSEARLGGHKRAASMQKQEHIKKVLQGRMERLERADAPREIPSMRLDFTKTDPPANKRLIRCESLSFAFGNGKEPLFDKACFQVENGAHMRLAGPNGCGKSTLLRLIHEGHPSIKTVPKLKTGLLTQDLRHLDEKATVLENMRRDAVQSEAELRKILAALLFSGDTVQKTAAVLSGGEKLRLSLAMLIAGDCNMLLLDEPGNYLDIPSLEAVERALRDYPGALMLVSHDAAFAAAVTDTTLWIQDRVVVDRQDKAPPSGEAERLILELRCTRLVAEIAAAPPEKKEILEEEYREISQKLQTGLFS